ncbi:hypothetical protein [Aliiroseovarius lamellibrachiae]|uniref:hypothetical protein n=1 Tax=Aliiroseovarius lamellibrachiae TaxID=1924933 RepID=UPI001BDF7910|nr:hypothetical protein [Aliiroseovarius lamellibrachiae]MBT2131000.1 hypothetical protein [Aliiroseovarius lamellibrachiae]
MKCQHTARNSECGIQFKVLSNEHFAKEEERFLSQNGLLDGPSCGHCGTTYLSAPEEFVFNGANGKKTTTKGKSKAIGVRMIHEPCKGKTGARFTVSQSHIRQQDRRENIRILKHLVNDASINGLKRLLMPAKGKRKVGVKRIYDRIFWLEKTLLAYGKITLVGEQEAAMARTVPHIFRDMIKDDRFEWHVISFDKDATKPTRQKRAKEYDKMMKETDGDGYRLLRYAQ